MEKLNETQKLQITKLAFMYYATGSVKDIWGTLDGELGDLNIVENFPEEKGLVELCRAFNITTEEEVMVILNKYHGIYSDYTNFTLIQ